MALGGPSWGHLGASRGALGPLLGRSWGRLGGILGPSWSSLGPSWGHLEASKAHRKRKGEKAQIIDFPFVFEGFWLLGEVLRGLQKHLGPSCGPLGASWTHAVSYLELCWAIFSDLEALLGSLRPS